MTIHLRPYQTTAIDQLRAELARLPRGERRGLLVSPTGSGKTTMAGGLVGRSLAKGARVLFLAHRVELIDQAAARMRAFGFAVGIIKPGRPEDPEAPIQVASVQTIARRGLRPPADLVIVDEAHRSLAPTYLAILDDYKQATVVGLTATPIRLDGRGLGDVYRTLTDAANVEELTAAGYLAPFKVYAPVTPDLKGVRVSSSGDYSPLQLGRAMNKAHLVGDIVGHWLELAGGVPTVVFASSVPHSQAIAASFTAAGIAAEHIDGDTPDLERAAILARVATGTTRVVSNFSVLVEGWDCPSVACVVLARPTKSLGAYLQMVGRGGRPDEDSGKTRCVVLDHAGCAHTHGLPGHARRWILTDAKSEATATEPAPSVKSCPGCYMVTLSRTPTCEECGHVWPVGEAARARRKGPKTKAGKLRELTEREVMLAGRPVKSTAAWRREHPQLKSKDAPVEAQVALLLPLADYAAEREYSPRWASVQYNLVTGHYPSAAALRAVAIARQPLEVTG